MSAPCRNKEYSMKIALFFSLMVIAIVATVVAGSNSRLGFLCGLLSGGIFAFLFMKSFVEALYTLRK